MLNPVRKGIVDDSIKLEMWWMRDNGFFSVNTKAIITWTNGWMKDEYSIGFIMNVQSRDDSFIKVINVQEFLGGNSNPHRYEIRLNVTPCFFGGYRYWFLCPLCNKRAAVLYQPEYSNYLACRECHNLTYAARNLSPNTRNHPLNAHLLSQRMSKLDEVIHKTKYKGKATRKQRQYNKFRDRLRSLYLSKSLDVD